MAKIRERALRFLPEWVRKRIEVNVFRLFDFMKEKGRHHGSDDLILDAGAGEGRFYPEFVHTRYVAVDLAVGDAHWDYSRLDGVSELVRLPFPENTFDGVLCTQVLEHVPEPYLVLQELNRVLKPGARLYLSCPQSRYQHQKPYDFFRCTAFGLHYLLNKAGFHILELASKGGYFWFLSFQLVAPLLLFYPDPLDRINDVTFGYTCVAEKR